MSVPPNILSDPTIVPCGTSGAIWAGQSGIGFSGRVYEKFGESATRHAIVQQLYGAGGLPDTRRFRAYKSTNSGVTWAEVDSGNGPQWPANNAGVSGINGVSCGSCQDYAGKKIYLVYFDPAAFTLAAVSFDQATDTFGIPVVSAIAVTPPNTTSGWQAGNMAFRPGDGSVWLGLSAGAAGGVSVFQLVKFAGGTLAATAMNGPAGASQVTNAAFFGVSYNPADGKLLCTLYGDTAQSNISCFTIHSDDSFSALTSISSTASYAPAGNMGAIVDDNGEAKLLLKKKGVNTDIRLMRWTSSDAPVSFDSVDATLNANMAVIQRIATAPTGRTFAVYQDSPGAAGAGNNDYAYLYSDAPGQALSAEQFIAQGINNNSDLRLIPNFLRQASALGVSFGYQTTGVGGQGYLEAAISIPVAVASRFADTQVQVVPFPLPPIGNFAYLLHCGCDGRLYASVKGILRKCQLKRR